MTQIKTNHKHSILKKYLEFQKNGLVQYGKYLSQQLKISEKKKLQAAYHQYIEKQIVLNDKKLESINAKLSKY